MYSTCSVAQLKGELRKRKASTIGKKAALIERIEAYDRNNLVGVEDELEDEIPVIPALDEFRDVNASTNLPALSKRHIQEFAERFQVPAKGRLPYESRSLVTLRVVLKQQHVYFHAQCKAQMKKLLYIVLLKMDESGMILESQKKLKKKHNYYTQIQGQLFCTNRKYCNLVIYTFLDMVVIYIERDEEIIKEMVLKLTSFL